MDRTEMVPGAQVPCLQIAHFIFFSDIHYPKFLLMVRKRYFHECSFPAYESL